ncbi:MAG: hypothetical protein OXI17_10555 [Gammaproteobacteria bacterium]|nr:hypothetical protein [Gammaproteobacteria bacterium]
MSLFELLIFSTNIILSVSVVPAVVYEKQTGEYKGFLDPAAIFWLGVAAAAAWTMILISESPRVEPWQYSVISILFVIFGARFMVEGMHHHFHGEWLHKRGIWLLKKSRNP